LPRHGCLVMCSRCGKA